MFLINVFITCFCFCFFKAIDFLSFSLVSCNFHGIWTFLRHLFCCPVSRRFFHSFVCLVFLLIVSLSIPYGRYPIVVHHLSPRTLFYFLQSRVHNAYACTFISQCVYAWMTSWNDISGNMFGINIITFTHACFVLDYIGVAVCALHSYLRCCFTVIMHFL